MTYFYENPLIWPVTMPSVGPWYLSSSLVNIALLGNGETESQEHSWVSECTGPACLLHWMSPASPVVSVTVKPAAINKEQRCQLSSTSSGGCGICFSFFCMFYLSYLEAKPQFAQFSKTSKYSWSLLPLENTFGLFFKASALSYFPASESLH